MIIHHIVPPTWEEFYGITFVPWVLKYGAPSGPVKILDSGTFEDDLTVPTTTDFLKAIELCNPEVIVLPDSLGVSAFWSSSVLLPLLPPGQKVMFVPQARSMSIWRMLLLEVPIDTLIGLSSLRRPTGLRAQKGTRPTMMQIAHKQHRPFHLLGLNSLRSFYNDELPEARARGCRGVDTCAAFTMAARGLTLTKDSPRLFLGTAWEADKALVQTNMRTLEEWCNEL